MLHDPPKHRLAVSELRGIVSHKIELFLTATTCCVSSKMKRNLGSCPCLALLYMVTQGSDIVEALRTKRRVTVAAQVLLPCQVLFCTVQMGSEILHL
jgi:hypothetical protein